MEFVEKAVEVPKVEVQELFWVWESEELVVLRVFWYRVLG